MDEQERKMMLGAALEGESADQEEVLSGIELLVLCNLAWIGCLHGVSTLCSEQMRETAAQIRDKVMRQIGDSLDRDSMNNGLFRLTQAGMAMLSTGRLGDYLLLDDAAAQNEKGERDGG